MLLCCFVFLVQLLFVHFVSGLWSVGPSFAYVTHYGFLSDMWIRTQSAAIASGQKISHPFSGTQLTIHLNLATHSPELNQLSPSTEPLIPYNFASYLPPISNTYPPTTLDNRHPSPYNFPIHPRTTVPAIPQQPKPPIPLESKPRTPLNLATNLCSFL